MAQRRKATTYGKSSRKAIAATGDAFAQITAAEIWSVDATSTHKHSSTLLQHETPRDRTGNIGHRTSGRTVARASPEVRNYKQKKPTIRQYRSTSTPDVAKKGGAVFDVPSSEDEQEVQVHASRKRRRITPSIMEAVPYIHDDASLQKHVAAEVSSVPRDIGNFSPSGQVHESENVRSALKQRTTHEGSECNNMAPNRVIPWRGAVSQAKRLTPAKPSRPCTPKQKEELRGKGRRPPTPEDTSNAAEVHQLGGVRDGPHLSMRHAYPPTTPPRTTKTPDGVTTPRQRELWNRLLTVVSHNTSPTNLGLVGLELTDRKRRESQGPATSRQITWETAQDIAPKGRPKRLVDTLKSVENGLMSTDANSPDDEVDSVGSDDRSSFAQSGVSAVNGALTLQTSPSADGQGRTHHLQEQILSHPSQPLPSLHGAGLKVTYARQRSYLTDDDLNGNALSSMSAIPEAMNRKFGRRNGLGCRAPEPLSSRTYDEDLGDLQESQTGAMRSIHELREAGGNVRLVSELEAILDDIDDRPLVSATLWRSRMSDLVIKLQEPSSCRTFIDSGFESRLLAHVSSNEDLITDSLLAVAILQLLIGPSSIPALAQISSARVVNFLIRLLGVDVDLKTSARLRQYKLSKLAQQEYRTLCDSLLGSTGWRAGQPPFLSCHVLALQCLEHLVRQTREARLLSEIVSAGAICRIIDTSIPSFSTPPPSPTVTRIISLELAVSILELSTIRHVAEYGERLWAGETLERIIGLLPLLASWKQEQYSELLSKTLRLYLNLTNNNTGLCEDFSTPDITAVLFKSIITNFELLSDPKCDRVLVLDLLILSLASCINLAESSEIMRCLVWKLHYDSKSYLDVLLDLFTARSQCASQVYSEEETSSNVALGYLAMLLGILCLNSAVKAQVSARLPGGNLKQLVDAVEEFMQYHKQIDEQGHRVDGEEDAKAGTVGRLQGLVDDLRA